MIYCPVREAFEMWFIAIGKGLILAKTLSFETFCKSMHVCIYMYKGSGTYPCTLLSKQFLIAEKHQEKHKCISKDGSYCCGYSGDRIGRFFRWASSLVLNIFTAEAVTTSSCRSFHIFTTLWLKVNLRRSSLDRSFRSFSECPRSLEVSAIWKKSCHWTPSRKPWRIL